MFFIIKINKIVLFFLIVQISMTLDASAELKINSVYPPIGLVGHDLEVTITGTGFNENTSVIIYPSKMDDAAIIGRIDTPGSIEDVLVNGNLAYVADGTAGLTVIDLSDSSSPSIIASLDTPENAMDIERNGDIIYVSDRNSMVIIDISVPGVPLHIGSIDIPAYNSKVYNNFLFINTTTGLAIYDIVTASAPTFLNNADLGNLSNFIIQNNAAFATDKEDFLLSINIDEPSLPFVSGKMEIPYRDSYNKLTNLLIFEEYIYAIRRTSGIHVFNISSVSNPLEYKRVDAPWPSLEGIVESNIAYIPGGFGIAMFDVSTPSNPILMDSIELTDDVYDVFRASDHNFILANSGELLLISTPLEIDPINITKVSMVIKLPIMKKTNEFIIRAVSEKESYEITNSLKTAENLPDIYISPDYLNLGVEETSRESSPKIFQIHNLTNDEIEISSVSILGTDSSEFHINSDNCSEQKLSALKSCQVVVSMLSDSMGKKRAMLTVDSAGAAYPPAEAVVSGWAIKKGFYEYQAMWPVIQQAWYFSYPDQIAYDEDGYIYIVDKGNARVIKFTENGHIITQWGKRGHGDGEFLYLESVFGWGYSDIAVDGSGCVYVLDSNKIQKFTSQGDFLFKFGGDDDEFSVSAPTSLAVDKYDNVWVADYSEGIHKFTSSGKYLTTWQSGEGDFPNKPHLIRVGNGEIIHIISSNIDISRFTLEGDFLNSWEGPIFTSSQYFAAEMPIEGMTIDNEDNIFIAAPSVGYILQYSPFGEEINRWKYFTSLGEYSGAFSTIAPDVGITVDKEGNLYCTNGWNNDLVKMNKQGELISKWGGFSDQLTIINGSPRKIEIHSDGAIFVADVSDYSKINKYDSDGKHLSFKQLIEDAKLCSIDDLSIDSNGYIYALAQNGNYLGSYSIYKLDKDLSIMRLWEIGYNRYIALDVDSNGNMYVANESIGGSRIYKFDKEGALISTYHNPDLFLNDIAIGDNDSIYALDFKNGVFKYSKDFDLEKQWGGPGSAIGLFWEPASVTIDSFNRVFVSDTDNNRIQIFTSDGDYIGMVGQGYGFQPGQFNKPTDVAVSPDGKYVYVVEEVNKRHQKFRFTTVENKSKAIIVAGRRSKDDDLWNTTQACANFAFITLTHRGFTKENIYYLSSNQNLDLDGNSQLDDVDGEATIGNVEYAITEWAKDADNIVIYLVDHGNKQKFYLNEDNNMLSANDLNLWLDQLQKTMKGKIILLYDACYSGSFISSLASDNDQRIIITSTNSNEKAKFDSQGAITFSYNFWSHVFNGLDVYDSYELARNTTNYHIDDQNPQIDADGNGYANEDSDFLNSQGVFIGSGMTMQENSPKIGRVSAPEFIDQTKTAKIEAIDVVDDDGISRVWAVVRPPNLDLNSNENDIITKLPFVDLVYKGENRYEGFYEHFHVPGIYVIAVYATDKIGNTCIPSLVTVNVKNPIRRKAVVLAGGTTDDPFFASIEKNMKTAYDALVFQGYLPDDIYLMSPGSIFGVNKLPTLPTLSNLNDALTRWASENTQDVVLYMIGKGGDSVFQMNNEEILTATKLNEWLGVVQNNIPGEIVVIYDSCLSGSFMPRLAPVAGKRRIVISSSTSVQPACFLSEGDISFSQYFWRNVLNGVNIRNAFINAYNIIIDSYENQTPLLDDDGDGMGNGENDGDIAKHFIIGNGIMIADGDPIVGTASPGDELNGGNKTTIWADNIIASEPLNKVWAVVIPPDNSASCEIKQIPIAMRDDGTGRYTAECDIFYKEGNYTVLIYAKDAAEKVSEPIKTSIYQTVELQAIKGDINGDGNANLIDAVIALKVLASTSENKDIRWDYPTSGADIDQNGQAGMAEAIYLLQQAANLR